MKTYYVVNADPETASSASSGGEFEVYSDAASEAITRAEADRQSRTYYVHQVETRPVFKAGAVHSMYTEVIP